MLTDEVEKRRKKWRKCQKEHIWKYWQKSNIKRLCQQYKNYNRLERKEETQSKSVSQKSAKYSKIKFKQQKHLMDQPSQYQQDIFIGGYQKNGSASFTLTVFIATQKMPTDKHYFNKFCRRVSVTGCTTFIAFNSTIGHYLGPTATTIKS